MTTRSVLPSLAGRDRKNAMHLISALRACRAMKVNRVLLTVVMLGAVAAPTVARAASPAWKVLAATGPTNIPWRQTEIQQLTTNATAGSFTLTFNAQTTPPLSYDATDTQVQDALNSLSSIGGASGHVDVIGGLETKIGAQNHSRVYAVTFTGAFSQTDVSALTVSTAGLTGTAAVDTAVPGGGGTGTLIVYPINVGGAATTGPYTVQVDLPAGMTTTATPTTSQTTNGNAWSCTPSGAGATSVSCTRSTVEQGGNGAGSLLVPVAVSLAEPGTVSVGIHVSGGAASAAAVESLPVTVSEVPAKPGVQAFLAGAYDADGNPETRAGVHPYSAISGFYVNTIRSTTGVVIPAGTPRDVQVDLPAGFTVNPLATPRCARSLVSFCDTNAVVGGAAGLAQGIGYNGAYETGLFSIAPNQGSAAQLTFPYNLALITIEGHIRPDDFGGRAVSSEVPSTYKPYGGFVTLWGAPGDPSHDIKRCVTTASSTGVCSLPNPGTAGTAFLTNPTECSGTALDTLISIDTYQNIGTFSSPFPSASPAVTDCSAVPFAPIVTVSATSAAADAASGLNFDVAVDQAGLLDPTMIAPSHVKDVAVALPEGISVNPSGATGLAACSDAQIQVGTDTAPTCPDGSKLGTVQATSPLADHAIGGTLYLGTPKSTDPASGQMLRLFVVARDEALGVTLKIPGSAVADPQSGRLTATFKNNPRLPFDHLAVKVKGGNRGLLATPQTCGDRSITSTLSPWSGTVPVTETSPLSSSSSCAFGFAPKVTAGNSNPAARHQAGTFSFTFSRQDGEQWVNGLTVALPAGLLASVKDVALCSDADATAGSCPAGSKIGTVDGSAGSGTPFVLEQKGSAFLTEGYKGCAYGLDVTVPVVAGPFDASSPDTDLGQINVRQSVCVDPTDAHVTVTSDPLPTIWHGIPLRVRSITVAIDRQNFMVNPSDCSAKTIGAGFLSPNDGKALASSPFQVTGCDQLAFTPKIGLSLTGGGETKDGGHPGITALVTQQPGEAGIKTAKVTLPLQLALDPNNAEGLCEYTDSLKYQCPDSSIIGTATAYSPLLNKPLTGPVYFSKNVRFNAKGQPIRTLPTLAIPLKGEIAVNLRANTNVDAKNRLVNTFGLADAIPDAPISAFVLNINGGKHGVIVVTRNQDICRKLDKALAETDGHNGAQHDFLIGLGTPCAGVPQAKSVQAKGHLIYLRVTLPGAGTLTVRDLNGHYRTATRTVQKAGSYFLALKPSKQGRIGLDSGHSLTAALGMRFKPQGAKSGYAFSYQEITVKPDGRRRRR